jgi:pimeloyl-ACP methyl ester carboxylesterase
MGHSMGAKVSAWMALLFPERVRTLVLVAPGVIVPEGRAVRPPVRSPEEMLELTMAHPERRPDGFGSDPAVTAAQRAFLERINAIARDDELIGRLGEVQTPTLALFGTSDGLISPDLGREYRSRLPNGNLAFVYDASHEIMVDRPEAFAGVVADFLERQEVFVVGRRSGLINP